IASCVYGKVIQIWRAQTKELWCLCTGSTFEHINTLTWSPDGRMLASGDRIGMVQIWDSRTGDTLRMYNGHTNGILSVAWSPNGRYLASSGEDTTVRIWRDPSLFL
ncbi:MAG: WD40 repeat domain-containing protein, partial [Ktedonobacteraceae bacterium]